MSLAKVLTEQYEKFIERDDATAAEHMTGWLMSAGREVSQPLKSFDKEFDEVGLNLRQELDKLSDILTKMIGEEQVMAILYNDARDNSKIFTNFQQAAHFLNFATETTARFE